FLAVCGAGAVGCGLRYLIGLGAATRLPATFPYGTLIVNLVGSFVIALVMEIAIRNANMSETLRLAITTGFLGGLTTYSSFNYESSQMLLNGQLARGAANIAVTLAGCFLMGLLGLALARRIV
ncbi:MAG: fluoride efflux transporter CrcB, partial [Kofleriaceae bacterium]